MHSLPADWASLAAVVFLLGMKHGCDADHLATIDGLTRVGRRAGARYAPYCGVLFSLGHGTVVLAIAALVGCASEQWHTPAWLERSGVVISMFFLVLLGVLNLRAVFAAAPHEVVAPVGIKGRCLGRLAQVRRPWLVMVVGALFALSFDTVSQAALFAATAAEYGGVRAALWLGTLFLGGMLLTDGCNGLWIARLIARSDELARIASRVMGLAVGSVSLMVAAVGVARLAAPSFARWSEGHELAFGALVVGLVLLSFVAGRALARRRDPGRLLPA
ncbi:MAG TPA: nickel transporter [Steroidobacteraceae bacterium]|nr:nickel transporter [Steroidobacteraceae bacterium]